MAGSSIIWLFAERMKKNEKAFYNEEQILDKDGYSQPGEQNGNKLLAQAQYSLVPWNIFRGNSGKKAQEMQHHDVMTMVATKKLKKDQKLNVPLYVECGQEQKGVQMARHPRYDNNTLGWDESGPCREAIIVKTRNTFQHEKKADFAGGTCSK